MRYAHQQDSLAGLEEDRRGSLPKSGRRGGGAGRGGRKWTGSLGQRARASRGLPQAVVKISSYSHSAGAVWDRVNYVARDGELEVETANGETLDQVQLEQMVEDWSEETEERTRRQISMSAVVSFPKGVDEAKATEAARQFFQEAFAENHDYVFAPHTDAKQFHVHVVVQSAGHDGKQLRIRRDDIQDLRLLLAEKAHEQGIELDASPRWARGLDSERRPGPEIEGITRRGATPALGQGEIWSPERELAGAGRVSPDRQTQLEALVAVRRDRDPATPGVTPLEYARAAESAAGKIGRGENNSEKVETIKAAVTLAQFGWQMAYQSRDKAEDIAAARATIDRAERGINSQIRGLGEGWAQQEAIKALRPLSNKLSDYRREQREQAAQEKPAAQARTGGPESEGPGRAREPEGRRESAPEATACQALEYARSAAGVAGQIIKLTDDQDRVAAVRGAVQLARFGWDLAQKDTGTAEEREKARGVIDTAERALRFAINRIEDPQAKREAIQARETLYTDGVQAYRAERRETERQRRQEAEREEGAERERER